MTENRTIDVKGADGTPATKKAKKTVTNDDPNSKVCFKWWMLHECDSGCRKKKSLLVLTDQQKKDMNAFVKGIRKEK